MFGLRRERQENEQAFVGCMRGRVAPGFGALGGLTVRRAIYQH